MGAHAEGDLAAVAEVIVQAHHLLDVQAVAEHQDLAGRIGAVGLEVRQHAVAPCERVAGVVAHPVEQLAEIHVEVAQEGLQPDHVGQRDAEVAAVLARPRLQRGHLRVAQARAQRLERLQVLVRHRAVRGHAVAAGEIHVAGAHVLGAQRIAQQRQHVRVPVARIAAPGAVVGDAAVAEARGIAQQRGLGAQPALALGEIRRAGGAEPDLVDDRQQRHLEQDGVQPRAGDVQLDLAGHGGRGAQVDVLAVQVEQAEEIGEIRLHEAQLAHVVHLVGGEAQAAQVVDLSVDLVQAAGQVDARRAALEAVLDDGPGVLVQHRLHHRELVEVGIEQGLDDHGRIMRRPPRPATGPPPWRPQATGAPGRGRARRAAVIRRRRRASAAAAAAGPGPRPGGRAGSAGTGWCRTGGSRGRC